MSWIKIDISLINKPEVFRIANLVGQNRYEVVGHLLQFWSWIDQHTTTGRDIALTDSDIDVLSSCTGFAAALRSVKWIQGREGSLEIPNYERHNGSSAKARSLETEAKRLRRLSVNLSDTESDNCPTNTAQNVRLDKIREDKRREENTEEGPTKDLPSPSQGPSKAKDVERIVVPEILSKDSSFMEIWKEWVPYRKKLGKVKEWNDLFRKQLKELSEYGPEIAIKTLNASMMNGWTGIFPDKQINGKPKAIPKDYSKGTGIFAEEAV